ncbi:type II toxin-antitoxin system VapC family toxin [uncultured Jatrophihabitans sp.]|uniref:type II toxin-antitoxin system VapC family toxin n=1 Tax=uncultured Jatrophihabitans sp. TaxID=1610747 RepID=UPI0035C9E50C
MTRLLIDTSVLIKWFHETGESELVEARAIRDAHVRVELHAHVLDLAIYEVGNVLARALKWTAADVSDQLEDLLAIVGAPLAMQQDWLRDAAVLAESHALSFYDASWAAGAGALGVSLVSADRRLLGAGLAESPSAVASRLNLPV